MHSIQYADVARQVLIAHVDWVSLEQAFFKNTGEVKDFSRRRGLLFRVARVVDVDVDVECATRDVGFCCWLKSLG